MRPEDKRAMLDEVAQAVGILTPIEDDEISIRELAHHTKCAYVTAARRLEKMVAEGRAVRRQALVNGRTGWAYRWVDDDGD